MIFAPNKHQQNLAISPNVRKRTNSVHIWPVNIHVISSGSPPYELLDAHLRSQRHGNELHWAPLRITDHMCWVVACHDDVIKWNHFPRYWSFVWGIHRSPVNSPHKGQWRRALMFPFICAWINVQTNNREAGDFRHHSARYDVTVMSNDRQLHCYLWVFFNYILIRTSKETSKLRVIGPL